MTQLSYFTSEPRARVPRSTALVASGGLLAVVGLLSAWDAFHALPPSGLGWRGNYQPQRVVTFAIWASIFVGSAIAVGRTTHSARAIVLGMLPVFVLVNLDAATARIIVDSPSSPFNGDWAMAATVIAPLVICIVVFVYFCSRHCALQFAERDSASWSKAEVPFRAWALGCVLYGFMLTLRAFWWNTFPPNFRMQHWMLQLSLYPIILVGGAVALLHVRSGWIVAMGGICTLCALSVLGLCLNIQRVMQPSDPVRSHFWMAAVIVSSMHVVGNVFAASVGAYAYRFLAVR